MKEAGLSTLQVAAAAAGGSASVMTASGKELTGEAAIAALLEKEGPKGATPAHPGGGGMPQAPAAPRPAPRPAPNVAQVVAAAHAAHLAQQARLARNVLPQGQAPKRRRFH